MTMKIAGDHTYPVPREDVWAALLDAEVLSRTLPGAEELRQVSDSDYEGKLKMKVGPVQGVFQGRVTITDRKPPESYGITIDGKGAPGFVKGKGSIRLEEAEGGTRLFYDIDAQVGGRIAAVGQRLLDSSAKVITRQGLEGLGRQLEARAEAAASDRPEDRPTDSATARQAPSAIEPPSQSEMARDFAKGMYEEMVPGSLRPALGVAIVLLVITVIAIVLRACS